MPELTAPQLDSLAAELYDALYRGQHDETWPELDEEEREDYRRAVARIAPSLGAVAELAAPVVAKARSVIETKVWAATLAGLVMAVAPIAYDVAVAYVAGWPQAPSWVTPLLVVLGTLGAGYGAKHTPRPDLVAA